MHGRLDVHLASDIASSDLQSIIESIPVDIRRWQPDDIGLIERDSGEVGLFESFRQHVLDENLTRRFRQKLTEFETRDQQAFDVYIMACYVAACRTIVSFDMIYAYLPNKNKRYEDVYNIIRTIDSFMVEIDLEEDKHQYYFSVRSGALARIALKECSGSAFSRVFERFHNAVPSRLIVDYPVFRRYAYDNDFARRAFPNVLDGKKFYTRLVSITDNAYDYQHGAIYLSKSKDFKAAFGWIDTAISKSRGRVFSIRNTHARILFESNIDVIERDITNQTAIEGIIESMSVLQDCVKNDARRSYHILRYGDQALIYFTICQDTRAKDWLTFAKETLQSMVDQASVLRSRESYNLKKYRNILHQITDALSYY